MFKYSIQNIVLTILLSFTALQATAQTVKEPRQDSNWVKPYPPFRIAGNLYYVGTYDLGCYLITTPKGNILINTGLASSGLQIKSNIESLGFKVADTKILLNTQAHYDHLGAMAAMKEITHAKLMVDEKDADAITTGGNADYEMGKYGTSFRPVKPDRLLHDSDLVKLGNMKLVLLHHPGHTKGSCSFLFTVKDDQKSYRVLIANMPTIITDRALDSIAAYPQIAADYAYTLQGMKNIPFDIWLASHASQFNLHSKHKPGDAYNPAAFADQAGYDEELKGLQEVFDGRVRRK